MGKVGLHIKGEISLEDIIREIKGQPQSRKGGAIGCFMGVVREDGLESGAVQSLEYEAYKEMAEKKLSDIRNDLLNRKGIVDLSIHHVIDKLVVGENSLYVVVMAQHRKQMFPVLDEAVDRVKTEAPIWKKEFTDADSYWVTERVAKASQNGSNL